MPKPQENMITWIVSMEQANLIVGILAKHPFETVADTIASLQQQAQSQLPFGQQRGPVPGNGKLAEADAEMASVS